MESLSPNRSKFFQVTLDQPASQSKDAVRLQEFNAVLSGYSLTGHHHSVADIDGFAASFLTQLGSSLGSSNLLRFTLAGSVYQGSIGLIVGGGLLSGVDGYGVDFGTGANQAARGNHTHAQLHNPVTLNTGTKTIDASMAVNQVLGLEVRLKANGGLKAPSNQGVECDFGTGANQVAAGNHTHAQLHNPVTVGNTRSLGLFVDGSQLLSGVVICDPNPGSGKAKISEGPNGLYIEVGPSGGLAAAGDHTHDDATIYSSGFLSAADKQKLDLYALMLQVDTAVPFVRHDVCPAGEYVGGRRQWGQAMQVVNMHLTANAPASACLLGLEINNSIVETISVPGGSAGSEVNNFKTLSNVFAAPSQMVRVKMLSGTGTIETEAARLDVCLTLRPALATLSTIAINSGGGAVPPWQADGFYSGGGSLGSTNNPITGIGDGTPMEVYQTNRYVANGTMSPIVYTFTGLGRGIVYVVNFHFAEFNWTDVGQQRMKLEVIGKTTGTIEDYDILSATSGVRFKADVQSLAIEPDANGQLIVKITPRLSTGGMFNLSINGLELVPLINP